MSRYFDTLTNIINLNIRNRLFNTIESKKKFELISKFSRRQNARSINYHDFC